MRISVHGHGFELRAELRRFVESRLSSSLSRFRSRIRQVSVHLAVSTPEGVCQPARCDASVMLYPSGEVRVWTEDAHMDVVIAKASERLRTAVEREVSQGRPVSASSCGTQEPVTERIAVAADSGMCRRQRKRLERPEHERWRISAGEYWRSSGLDSDEWPEHLKEAVETT